MSLNWQWNDKIGKAVYNDGRVSNLYRGNAFCIAVNEWEDNGSQLYCVAWFFCDESHAKNCLGLSKGYDGCFGEFDIKELHLNTKYTETAKLAQMLAKAKVNISIVLYWED